MGYVLWAPRRIKSVEQDCQRLNKAKGKIIPNKVMKYKGKRRHLITDYSHIMPKLHCPWDEDAAKKRNEISPGLLYHGLHSTDVTERLQVKPPKHCAHPSIANQPEEYHGRVASNVTEMYTFASRGKRPPSRDQYFGREATDISEFLRIIPPVAKEGDESTEFFGRPKSDVTIYTLFPLRTIDTNSRTEAARPLGRCPPGPMCDYVPLIRDEKGKLMRPQPNRPPSPLCTSGTHELPVSTTLVQRHQPESEQQFVPGAGGILAQIVPGFSRSEAKKPVGRGVPGVMADYVQLVRDETGKMINTPGPRHWLSPRDRSPNGGVQGVGIGGDGYGGYGGDGGDGGSGGDGDGPRDPDEPLCGDVNHDTCHPKKWKTESDTNEVKYANRDERKRPLGKVPVGVMHDFVPNPTKGKHKHTTDGYWALPAAYPQSPPYSVDPDSKGDTHRGLLSPGPMNAIEASKNAANTLKYVNKKLKKDRRRNQVCEMHEPRCPFAAEQGHVGSCITHPTVSSYVKWPKDGDLELGPCKKHGGRTGIFSVRGSPCSSAIAAASAANSGAASPCCSHGGGGNSNPNANTCTADSARGSCNGSIADGSVRSESRPRTSPRVGRGHGGGHSRTESLANQTPLKLDTACPRAACQCIRVANKGAGPPVDGYAESISRLDPKYRKKKPGSAGSMVSTSSKPPMSAANSKGKSKKPPKKKSMAFVTEETSPQHFRVPYFGLAQTDVTNPAVSPNFTPPLRRQAAARNANLLSSQQQENLPTRSCSQADVCKHHQDGTTAWFGRAKTFVTDPAVSPNLTPPCFQLNFR
ncbi:unnamed protein product [Calypogeia fissa]